MLAPFRCLNIHCCTPLQIFTNQAECFAAFAVPGQLICNRMHPIVTTLCGMATREHRENGPNPQF